METQMEAYNACPNSMSSTSVDIEVSWLQDLHDCVNKFLALMDWRNIIHFAEQKRVAEWGRQVMRLLSF